MTNPWLALLLAVTLPLPAAPLTLPAAPLSQAHAHNDYEHPRPLLDALDRGFCSVEADIWLIEGELLVAHSRSQTRPGRTLQALYLDPLQARCRVNQGRVHPKGPPFTLLIDVKSEATNTYRALHEVLCGYEPILTRFQREHTQTNAVTILITGNRARGLMATEQTRLAAYDGRLADLELQPRPSLQFMPLVSDDWEHFFKWRAEGPLPEAERKKLRRIVNSAHQQGRRLRFWGAPDTRAAWQELTDAGVDLINTDDLAGLQQFLATRLAVQ